MIENLPLDSIPIFDIVCHNPTTGGVSDADSVPTFDVYENAVDTGMLGATNFTKRTSLTGNYRGTFTASAANGFEVGKFYNVIASATVASTAAKKNCGTFRIIPAESSVGTPEIALTTAERNSVAAALLDLANGIETGLTLRQAQRIALAALAGKLAGAATTTITVRDVNDAKNRITATVDGSGNRSTVTLDAT